MLLNITFILIKIIMLINILRNLEQLKKLIEYYHRIYLFNSILEDVLVKEKVM